MAKSRISGLGAFFVGLSLGSQIDGSTAHADDALTIKGITLYGAIDMGLQLQTHGAPVSDYFPGGSTSIVQKNGNHTVIGITPNNLGQSKIGVHGLEPITGEWAAVFELETFFDPQSGELSDGLKSLTLNNGRTLVDQGSNADSSVAGQVFQQAFVGVQSDSWGRLTFGRQNGVLADGIAKYDPNYAALAFSLIGQSGTAAGGGYTQDRRLDAAVKYDIAQIGIAHFAVLYKANGSRGDARMAVQANIGVDTGRGSIDAYYARSSEAISAAPLSATQLTSLTALGISPSNALSGVVSDNEAYALMASLHFGASTFFAGYEFIRFANPANPLNSGVDDIGGYKLAFVNDDAYPNDKHQQIYWAGARYLLATGLHLSVAYYGYRQNSYAAGAYTGCQSTVAPSCGGTLDAWSALADYHWSHRFDTYAGLAYTAVHHGLASGYLHSTDLDPTIGARYVF